MKGKYLLTLSKKIKILYVSPEAIKLLEESMGSAVFGFGLIV